MTFQIPNTFIPGTKAKANEVNENFNAVKTEFASHAALIAQNTKSISAINTNITTDLNNKLGYEDMPDIVSGLTLSYLDGTLTIKAGFCMDSTRQKFMRLKTEFYKDTTKVFAQGSNNGLMFESNIDASSTYNVFLIAKEDSTTDVIATKDEIPRLTEDFVYFAKIGNFYTDENGAISQTFPHSSLSELFIAGSIGFNTFPDYTRGVSKAWGAEHVAEENGWLYAYSYAWEQTFTNPILQISGVRFNVAGCAGMYACSSIFHPVSKGETYGAYHGVTNSLIFFPTIGY